MIHAPLTAALAAHEAGDLAAARARYLEVLAPEQGPPGPATVIALIGLADLAGREKDLSQAVDLLRLAVDLQPGDPRGWQLLGDALSTARQNAAARDAYHRAVTLDPDLAHAWRSRGVTEWRLGRFAAARDDFRRAAAVRPERPEEDRAKDWHNVACASLLLGDFAEGWDLSEWRWQTTLHASQRRATTAPFWTGREPLEGKTVFVHSEQGLGDTLQFCRYVPLLAARGARVIFEAQIPLLPLLRTLPGGAELRPEWDPPPPCDYFCPLLSLPGCFGTRVDTIPAEVPYLAADPDRVALWARRLGEKRRPRIGLAWSGNPEHPNDARRSLPLAALAPLLALDAEFVSLQPEVRPADEATLAACPRLRQFGAELRDFSDTAALCQHLDRIVTVDTSVAHLAGALARPTHLLLPLAGDWRWLAGRRNCPWYPTFTVHRQSTDWVWEPVIAEACAAVAATL
jgi:tetratricopeptide (TPR) repeat protein